MQDWQDWQDWQAGLADRQDLQDWQSVGQYLFWRPNLSFWRPGIVLGVHFEFMLLSFGSHFGFMLNKFGSILVAFWTHVGLIFGEVLMRLLWAGVALCSGQMGAGFRF